MTTLRDWTLTYAWNAFWQVPLLWAAGALAARILGRAEQSIRHRLWVVALLLAAILPAVPWRPAVHVGWLWNDRFGAHTAVSTSLGGFHRAAAPGLLSLPSWLLNVCFAIYLAFVVLAAVRFCRGVLELHAIVREAQPAELSAGQKEHWAELLLAYQLPVARLAESARVTGPTAVALSTPTVLLPPRFVEEAAAGDLVAALGHECAHLRRRDFAKQVIYTACSLPITMHPVTVWLQGRVGETREMLCDALAAQTQSGTENYAAALLRIAAMLPTLSEASNLHAIGMLDANSLERRIIIMLHPQQPRSRMHRFGSVLAAAVLGVATCASALALHMEVSSTDMAGARQGNQLATTPPEIVYRKAPIYPAAAKANNSILNGTVTLAVEVNADGKPTSVRVEKSLRSDYDQSAVDAVTEWRFNPALENGKAVASTTSVNINYMIQP